jgi:hypothetical protein
MRGWLEALRLFCASHAVEARLIALVTSPH